MKKKREVNSQKNLIFRIYDQREVVRAKYMIPLYSPIVYLIISYQ